MKNILLTVCLLTYRRNQLLSQLLAGLIKGREGPWEVVVVDTSGEGLADEVLREYRQEWLHGVYGERRLNISEGRNMALDHANGEWILFLDDDQVFSGELVEQVIFKLKACEGLEAARLSLRTKLSGERTGSLIEAKLRKSSYYMTYDPKDSHVIKSYHLSTDGVVFRKPPSEMRFLPELGYRGGEDNDFFARYLGDQDCPIWHDVEIIDSVMPDRITLRYIWRDSFRRGCSYAQLETGPLERSRISLLVKYIVGLIGAIGLLLGSFVLWRDWPNRVGLLSRQCGKLSGLLGLRYELYRDGGTNISR